MDSSWKITVKVIEAKIRGSCVFSEEYIGRCAGLRCVCTKEVDVQLL